MMSDDPNRQSDSTPISIERVLEILERGKLDTEHGMMRWSSNYTFLVSVEHEDRALMAVYKPQKGERPLWDFPDGTLCYRERAAFLTSHELDWQIVPPTVLRSGPRGLGSVQFYIDHDPDINYFTFDAALIPQLMRLSLFDCMVNNADRKGGHCLLDSREHLWGIDHGITFNTAPKLRTVIWDFAGQAIPEPLLADLDALCGRLEDPCTPYHLALKDLLSESEIRAFQTRVRNLLRTKRYPKPGSGPNYPWPPV